MTTIKLTPATPIYSTITEGRFVSYYVNSTLVLSRAFPTSTEAEQDAARFIQAVR